MKKIIIDRKYTDKRYELLFDFLSSFVKSGIDDIEENLNNFVEGRGIFLNDIGIVFSNDPSENMPGIPREFEELENFEGVGIYCDWYDEDSPLLLTYQEFYENLISYIEDQMKDKSGEIQIRINDCLDKNINKYNVK